MSTFLFGFPSRRLITKPKELGIKTGDPHGFNKGRNSKFREASRVRQTPDEGRRTYRPKRCRNKNKDEDNSPKTLNDKNYSKERPMNE